MNVKHSYLVRSLSLIKRRIYGPVILLLLCYNYSVCRVSSVGTTWENLIKYQGIFILMTCMIGHVHVVIL